MMLSLQQGMKSCAFSSTLNENTKAHVFQCAVLFHAPIVDASIPRFGHAIHFLAGQTGTDDAVSLD
jgi:hypothetical protein